jgi:DNA-binding NtrC family response regulator
LAHAAGTGEFFSEGVAEIFRPLCDRLDPIRVPCMEDRTEDIAGLCHTTIGMLRAAHPFLTVQGINNEAIAYLVETRADLNHQKLVRILRNSTALCQRPVLGVGEVKSYGESEISSQHLLESMADEAFFPAEETVNF